jgi:hypothetical protein
LRRIAESTLTAARSVAAAGSTPTSWRSAESEWGNFLDDLRDGPSFWDRLTGKG